MTTVVNGTDKVVGISACDNRTLPAGHSMYEHVMIAKGYTPEVEIKPGESADLQMPGMLDVEGQQVITDGILICVFDGTDAGESDPAQVCVFRSATTEIQHISGMKIFVRPEGVEPPPFVTRWRRDNPEQREPAE